MPASMMSEETGSSWNVIGSSMAIVAVAPMPGSTPMRVPRITPIRQKNRFSGEAAVAKPSARLERSSICGVSSDERQPGSEAAEREAETVAEDQCREDRKRDGQQQ